MIRTRTDIKRRDTGENRHRRAAQQAPQRNLEPPIYRLKFENGILAFCPSPHNRLTLDDPRRKSLISNRLERDIYGRLPGRLKTVRCGRERCPSRVDPDRTRQPKTRFLWCMFTIGCVGRGLPLTPCPSPRTPRTGRGERCSWKIMEPSPRHPFLLPRGGEGARRADEGSVNPQSRHRADCCGVR